MLKSILNLTGVQELNKKEQKTVLGACGFWPTTEENCLLCGGEWEGICALPVNSVCL